MDDLLRRLARSRLVDGVALLGSSASGRQGPASDHDLLILLGDPSPPLLLALTHIDGRLADVLFQSVGDVDAVLRGEPTARGWPADRLIAAARKGRVVLDRAGRLARLAALEPSGASTEDAELLWFRTWYDVHQTRRMLASDDPVYETAVDLRLLYGLHQAWTRYFASRRIVVAGEQEAIHWLERNDSRFLRRFRECLAEGDRARRFELYAELAARAVEPLADAWPDEHTAVQMLPGAEAEAERGLAFWEELVRANPRPS